MPSSANVWMDLCPFIRAFIYNIHKKKFTMCNEWLLAGNEQNRVIISKTTQKKKKKGIKLPVGILNTG
jgi:hypothetical protein